MRTLNDTVAVTPFPFSGTQVEMRASGLKQIANYTGLVPLQVLVGGPAGICAGDIVFVSGKDVKAPWGLNRYKLPDGKECIFAPLSAIFIVQAKE